MEKKELPFNLNVEQTPYGLNLKEQAQSKEVFNKRMLKEAMDNYSYAKKQFLACGAFGAVAGIFSGVSFSDFLIQEGVQNALALGSGFGAAIFAFCASVPSVILLSERKQLKKCEKLVKEDYNK